MANAREIKSRISSVQDTMKITNAMYMISSSKMKKAKKILSDTEPYFYNMQSDRTYPPTYPGYTASVFQCPPPDSYRGT